MTRRITYTKRYRAHTNVEAAVFIVPMIALAVSIAIIMWAVIL